MKRNYNYIQNMNESKVYIVVTKNWPDKKV